MTGSGARRARVVVLGSSNTDMTVRLPRLPARGQTMLGGAFLIGPGGKGANQAVAARRAGAEVVFLTAVGDDDFGRRALDGYRREGIDVRHVRVLEGAPSGVALIFVDESGENMIGVAPGANALLTPEDVDRLPDSVFKGPGVFLASLEVPLATAAQGLRRAKAGGMIAVLNPAPVDYGLIADDADILPLTDVLTPNHDEALALAGVCLDTPMEALGAALAIRDFFGARDVIVTRGAEGCLVLSGADTFAVPAYPAEVVDTVGAGDAYNGALAVALAEGRPLLDAAVWAALAASLAVARPGAQAGLPFRAEIDRLAAAPHAAPRPFDEYYRDYWSATSEGLP